MKYILKLFLSKTTVLFDSKISWNVPWMVLFQMFVLNVDHIFKMAFIAGQNVSIGACLIMSKQISRKYIQ